MQSTPEMNPIDVPEAMSTRVPQRAAPLASVPVPAAMKGCFPVSTRARGAEFHHVQAGQGLPLVFLHGVLGDWRTWAPQWEAFTARYDCLAYSRRHNWPNRNPHIAPDHSALTEAQDLEALLDTWGRSPAVLVGSSYGAFTALALAVRAPDRVQALVLAEPPMLRWADRVPGGQAVRDAFERDVRLPARDAFLAGDDVQGVLRLTGGIVGDQAMATMAPQAMAQRMLNARSIKALTLSDDEFPWLEPKAVSALRCPILLLAGDSTPAIHATVFEALCQALPQAEVRRVPHAGHGVARDNPDFFNQHMLDFLERRLG